MVLAPRCEAASLSMWKRLCGRVQQQASDTPEVDFIQQLGLSQPKEIHYVIDGGSEVGPIQVEIDIQSARKTAQGYYYGEAKITQLRTGKESSPALTDRFAKNNFPESEGWKEKLQGKILAVGCGMGGLEVRDLHDAGYDVRGVDISLAFPIEGLLYRAAASKLPFKEGDFDTVVSAQSVFFYADPKSNESWDLSMAAFQEAVRVLEPGGKFYFDASNSWESRFRESHPGIPLSRDKKSGFLIFEKK